MQLLQLPLHPKGSLLGSLGLQLHVLVHLASSLRQLLPFKARLHAKLLFSIWAFSKLAYIFFISLTICSSMSLATASVFRRSLDSIVASPLSCFYCCSWSKARTTCLAAAKSLGWLPRAAGYAIDNARGPHAVLPPACVPPVQGDRRRSVFPSP